MRNKLAISLALLTMLFFTSLANAAELVNLNKANAAAIQQNLVGIGPIKAEAIVNYRKKNGKFKSLDDLQGVTGIGPALIKKNKRYLSLSKGVVAGDDKAYAASKKQAGKGKSSSSNKKTAKTAKKNTAAKDQVAAKPAKKAAKNTTKSKSKTDNNTGKAAKAKKKKKDGVKPAKKKKKPVKKKKKKTNSTT